VREQIRAASDLGIHGWVLWNPRSAYDARIFNRGTSAGAQVAVLGPTTNLDPDRLRLRR
jgi:hypothetical protein